MTARWWRVQRFGNALFAVALATGAVLVGWLAPGGPSVGVTRPLDAFGVFLLAAMTLPVISRQRWPISAAAISVVACGAAAMLGYPVGAGAFGTLLLLYSLAHVTSRRVTLLCGAPLGLGLVVGITATANDGAAITASTNLLVLGLALVAGDLMRSRDEQQELLRERHRQVEQLRAAETQAAVTEERMRIAREVHDAVSHNLVAITLQARAGLRRLRRAPDLTGDALRQIEEHALRALNETRTAIAAVRGGADSADTADGAALQPAPDLNSLTELVESMKHGDLDVSVTVDPAAYSVPEPLQWAAYRIVQESVSNAVRHGQPHRVDVRVGIDDTALVIEVRDDGRGSSPSTGTGSGLLGMRERAAQLGGTLDAGPAPDHGWRVRATLPLTPVPA